MKKLLDEFIYKSFRGVLQSNKIIELENTIEMNNKRLQKNLNKKQKKLLLKIGDTKDLKAERCSYESFIAGFKMGLQIGYETNKD